jgi:hypothetical protein
MMYAIIAALLTLIMLGLEWPAWWRDTMIVANFGFGVLDFAGQWLMKVGVGRFAWLTIASGWGMSGLSHSLFHCPRAAAGVLSGDT